MQWRVRLFDGPILENSSGQEIRHFRSQKVGALLAYLALRLGRQCSREELAFALWPEEDGPTVANRLRVSLASLRRQLEPAGTPFGSVLDVSVPGCVCLSAQTVWCDTAAFETALRSGDKVSAAGQVRGVLLPSYVDEWAILERHRLEALSEGLEGITLAASSLEPSISEQAFVLPLYLTRYFGREDEIERLRSMARSRRLVTITGPGGMGKTRFAVEAGGGLGTQVVFVPLADLTSGSQVPEAILRSLHLAPSVETELVHQIVGYLGQRGVLTLILDNAEHVVEDVAAIVLRLLQAVPSLRILVTTRQRLSLEGEAVFPLEPLSTPASGISFDELVSNAAVALFLDRARNARPDFALTERHAGSMLEICRMLDGMPLALELAAARVIAQTPAQIESSLRESLTDLKSRQRGLSSRHQSLRASVQGSFDLLESELQIFFAKLSVFVGGWTVAAAAWVTESPECEAFLEDLTIRSLILAKEDLDQIRYSFLEPIRRFAAEQLADGEETMRRHSEYFLGLALLVSEDDIATLRSLDSEQDNLARALETGHRVRGSAFWRALPGALLYGHIRGRHRSFARWAEIGLAGVEGLTSVVERVRLLYAAYYLFSFLGDFETIKSIGLRMRVDAEENGYQAGIIVAELILAYTASHDSSGVEAMALAGDALARARRLTDGPLIWRSLRILAWVGLFAGNAEPKGSVEGVRLLRESEALSRECLGLLPEGSSHLTFEQLTLCYILTSLGEEAEAFIYVKKAQRTAVAQGSHAMLLFAFREEARMAIQKGFRDHAAVFFGAYLQMREVTGYNSYDPEVGDPTAQKWMTELVAHSFEPLIWKGRKTLPADLAEMLLPGGLT